MQFLTLDECLEECEEDYLFGRSPRRKEEFLEVLREIPDVEILFNEQIKQNQEWNELAHRNAPKYLLEKTQPLFLPGREENKEEKKVTLRLCIFDNATQPVIKVEKVSR